MPDASNPQRIADMLIKDMPVPNRPRRWLQVAGIRSVGGLLERSAADLLTIENFGQTSLEHVERFLQRHGLELAEPQAEDLDETYVREGLRDRGCKLTRREREILKLRYGIADGRQMTLEEVGRLFDLSRERVRQIQKQAEQKVIARRTFKAATRRTAAAAAR